MTELKIPPDMFLDNHLGEPGYVDLRNIGYLFVDIGSSYSEFQQAKAQNNVIASTKAYEKVLRNIEKLPRTQDVKLLKDLVLDEGTNFAKQLSIMQNVTYFPLGEYADSVRTALITLKYINLNADLIRTKVMDFNKAEMDRIKTIDQALERFRLSMIRDKDDAKQMAELKRLDTNYRAERKVIEDRMVKNNGLSNQLKDKYLDNVAKLPLYMQKDVMDVFNEAKEPYSSKYDILMSEYIQQLGQRYLYTFINDDIISEFRDGSGTFSAGSLKGSFGHRGDTTSLYFSYIAINKNENLIALSDYLVDRITKASFKVLIKQLYGYLDENNIKMPLLRGRYIPVIGI